MPTKVPCYLRTLRRRWGLTQKEIALLVPRGRRVRVSETERGKVPPRASELLAYALAFGFPPQAIFPAYAETVADEAMRGALELDRSLEEDASPKAARKHEFLRQLLDRAALEPNDLSPL